jgi:hypothetical protein
LPGVLGTSSSFALRLGQAVFSSASLFFMCLDVDFYGYSAFWLVSIWFLIFMSNYVLGISYFVYCSYKVWNFFNFTLPLFLLVTSNWMVGPVLLWICLVELINEKYFRNQISEGF